MGIVLVLALILAWPTSGLSLLAVPGYAALRGYLRGKAGEARSRILSGTKHAQEAIEGRRYAVPSWQANTAMTNSLGAEALKAGIDAGMTREVAQRWLSADDTVKALLTAAAYFEREGFSRAEQVVATADYTKAWAKDELARLGRELSVPAPAVQAPVTSPAVPHPGNEVNRRYEEAQKLFQEGMVHALAQRSEQAIECYTLSIATCANPAPFINRANLLGKRIRHFEAEQDLLMASELDKSQGDEFGEVIAQELKKTHALTVNYRNGIRKTLPMINGGNARDIAESVLCQAFNVRPLAFENATTRFELLEFHFFNEIDDIVRFDNLARYPEVEEWVEAYPAEFIENKVAKCPSVDDYLACRDRLHLTLCAYEEEDMRHLRRSMLYGIHRSMMARDFGGMWDALDSDCHGVTKEAERFLMERAANVSKGPG